MRKYKIVEGPKNIIVNKKKFRGSIKTFWRNY